jgi:hypothetical protein
VASLKRVKLEEYIGEAYRGAAQALADLPIDLIDDPPVSCRRSAVIGPGRLSHDTQVGPLSSNAARSVTLPLWLAQDHYR